MDLKYICFKSHYPTLQVICWHNNKQSCQQFQILRCSSYILISETVITSSGTESQSISLDDSGKPLSSVNIRKKSYKGLSMTDPFKVQQIKGVNGIDT